MRKRCSSFSSSKTGIVCTNKDLEMILSGNPLSQLTPSMSDEARRRRSIHGSSLIASKRRCSTSKQSPEGTTPTEPKLSPHPRKHRTKSLQPNIVSWDLDNHVAVEPELIGSVIEKFLTSKRNSSAGERNKTTDVTPKVRTLTFHEKTVSPKLKARRLRASLSSSPQDFLSGAFPVRDDKRTIVVDEFDHPRRLSFGGWHNNRKSSCRSEDSVESALKKLNI